MKQNQFSFEINAKIPDALGRAGIIHTPHGDIYTPTFVVVGTYAKVKFLEPYQFHNINAQVMISNGFHLSKIDDEIEKAGGLSEYSGYNYSQNTIYWHSNYSRIQYINRCCLRICKNIFILECFS